MESNIKNLFEMQKEAIVGRIATLYEGKINQEFLFDIFNAVVTRYGKTISMAYRVNEMYENISLYPRTAVSICENYWFDMQRMDVVITEEYRENFIGRIVAQMLYSSMAENQIVNAKFLQHPVTLVIVSITNLLIYKMESVNNSPVFISLREAMISLSSTYILLNNKANSQALTVYRQYLEQLIIAITLFNNPHLYEKYSNHQRLTIEYAKNTSNEEIKALIEEKKIPARDVKSYLNYGWIEDIKGFDEMGRGRYSIKTMSKLSNIDVIYELYSNTSNYVHMNYLYAQIDWVMEVNRTISSTYYTLEIVMNMFSNITGYDFIWNNINLKEEFKTLSKEFFYILDKTNKTFDISK